MKMTNINRKEYWDHRFEHDWEMMHGREQTEFFAGVARQLMPAWLVEEIRNEKLTICDFGCAMGQAVDALHRYFGTEVSGVDFSERAIAMAKEKYPDCRFYRNDILGGDAGQLCADVGYTSNVLEHLDNPWEAAGKIAGRVKKYLVVLVPFRETLEIQEHCNIFDSGDIPLKIADLDLIYVNYMDCQEVPGSLYGGCQILLLYSRDRGRIGSIGDIAGAFESCLERQVAQWKEEAESARRQCAAFGQEKEEWELWAKKARKELCVVQGSRIYRMGLAMKRFIVQCVKTHDRRDFMKWSAGRLLNWHLTAKALREFDGLENVRRCLDGMHGVSMPQEIKESETVRFKKMGKVFLFASVPYYDVGGGQRSAQLAKAFHTLGYQVFYIYAFPCTESQIPEMFIYADEHRHIGEISLEWFTKRIDGDTMAIFEIPYARFEPYLDAAAGCKTVYEHIDNWDSSLGAMFYDAAVFKRFLEKADLLTVTAKKLGEKIRECTSREYLYLPNAVNIEVFEPLKAYARPKDLKRGKKTLLYFGSLWGEWFDWDKIDYIAARCPECQINLIGDYAGCMGRVRKKKKNVHFLGLKKHEELAAYLKYADVALLPFKNSRIGSYVSPLKVFEYIAMDVRVLATKLDDIQGYPNVYCSDSKEGWVRYIKKSQARKSGHAGSRAFIARNHWFARCGDMISRSGICSHKKCSISVIVLNYNNKNIIRRCVDTLLAHNRRYHYEIIVVDNGSRDGSYELLSRIYQGKVKLLRNSRNGCASGRNLGVENAGGEYLCFLDSDQWVVSDYWLDSVLEALGHDAGIGAVAWNAGWFAPGKTTGPIVDALPDRAVCTAKMWYRTDVAYLATSGFVMERSLFLKIGGFDEFYDPTCFEDTDLSLKIKKEGYKLAYCPCMAVMHLPHQTTQSGSQKHKKLMARNGQYFEKKWKLAAPKLLECYYPQ